MQICCSPPSLSCCRLEPVTRYHMCAVRIVPCGFLFFPKDDNLGVLMFTVFSVHVGGWPGVGACSAEQVGDSAGSAGGRLGGHCRRYHSASPLFLYPSPLPPTPLGARILATQTFRVAGVCILPTQTFLVAGVLDFTY